MTSSEFIYAYWSQYISIEKEFVETMHYVTLDEDNDNTFSQAYSKLMLQIGSEVDVAFQRYCKKISGNPKNHFDGINQYKDCVVKHNPVFIKQEIEVKKTSRTLKPWIEWNNPSRGVVISTQQTQNLVQQSLTQKSGQKSQSQQTSSPSWWLAYNAIKHNRTGKESIDGEEKECYKFANQKNTLHSLAGLYQILIYYYYEVAKDEQLRLKTPIPGSRLFVLKGGGWDSIGFFEDVAWYINDEGCLIFETGLIHY